MKLTKLFGLATLVSAVALAGCKDDKPAAAAAPQEPAARKLTVGVMTGAEAQVTEVAAKIAKEKYNIDVKLVEFTEYTQPNDALTKGDLDANAFQHKPYMDKEVEQRGYKLAIVGNTFVFPIAAYSKKIKNVSELQDGTTVAVPNNPSNLGRALLLLEKQGLIKLKDPSNLFSTSIDVIENPKNLQIKEVEGSLLPRMLDDVDFAIINNNYAVQQGLTAEKDGIFVEDKDSPYVNLVVSREDNKDNEAIKDFVKAFQTEEVYQEALKHFQGGVVKGW
ncbi:TPA: MetQ/NlpA family lipoprotein [Pasteurella multocida]|uniref:MetQ/NlpA family lipoprotein n=1 Tax=Pasteurella multocida TaxID=747 RepID=UPI00027B24A7|nr:MetQ/NlpA family lipoprotein [Pasteurella multocida]EJS86582.1 PlpB [Pasteurella multocida subsp. multocida str. Anand1_buffalo]APB78891.1 methionine ABC transporter substrate-binding protein MetQ [Pasteurella multocida]EJS83770.1 PlpB [Pasteurella multocida subsp. multocida str. P52VAC]EPE76260.1 protein PlpB [Pasteurella multocida 1500C]ERL40816.1 outer membrane lipoprotein 2 [Pasteurella multocida subsp. multocida str. PMTB]